MRFRQQSDFIISCIIYFTYSLIHGLQGLQLDQPSDSQVEPTLVSIWRCSINNGLTSVLSHWSHATDSTQRLQSKSCRWDGDRLSMYSFGEMNLARTTSRAASVTWRASLFETVSSSTLYAKVGHPRSAIYCVTIPPLNTLALCRPPQHFHKTMCPAVLCPGVSVTMYFACVPVEAFCIINGTC